MKMIYVGHLSKSPDRDSGWIREFSDLGWEVNAFSTDITLQGPALLQRVKHRLSIGKENRALQRELLALSERIRPDWIHFRLPIEFDHRTLRKLRARGAILTQYFNDDPFSSRTPRGLYWKFRRAIKAYDGHFAFRAHNVAAYIDAGASFAAHCPPTYDHSQHLSARYPDKHFLADAAFIGHWENDGREHYLEAIKKKGYSVILRGGMWDSAIKDMLIGDILPVKHAFGKEYNEIYANVMAGICFFSKINNDTWTRRPLEIIAVGGLLVCERTQEAESYFTDRKEAFYFSSIDELLEIISVLKSDPDLRERVRDAGYQKLMQTSNTIADRARQINQFVKSKLTTDNQV